MVAAVRELRVKKMIGGKLPRAAELSEPWTATQRTLILWCQVKKAVMFTQVNVVCSLSLL